MHETDNLILNFLKKRMYIVISMIVLILICLGILSYIGVSSEYNNRQLVNILGRQRMLTQMIAKDSDSINMLEIELRNANTNNSKNIIENEIMDSKNDLTQATMEFNNVFFEMKQGAFIIDGKTIYFKNTFKSLESTINSTNILWNEFLSSVNIITGTDSTSEQTSKAFYFIDQNNEQLLNYMNTVTAEVVNSAKHKTRNTIYTFSILGIATLAAVLAALFNIYKYLFFPLTELYSGMSQLGITSFELENKKPTKKELMPLIPEISSAFLKLNNVIDLIENINHNNSFREILEYIYKTFSGFIPYNHIGIALIEGESKYIRASYGISDEIIKILPEQLFGYRTEIKHTGLMEIIKTGEPRIINDLEEHTKGKPLKSYNQILLTAGIRSSIALPLKVSNRPVGVIFFSSIHKNMYNNNHIKFLRTLANSIAISLEKNIFADDLIYSSILALAKLAESRDSDTGDHLYRMKLYSRLIAELLSKDSIYKKSIDMEYVDNIERFSPLHDIGKVSIRDEILLKPQKLTKKEFEIMKGHTIYGAKVLMAAEEIVQKNGRSVFKLGIEIAESHHEKWDGSGYPYGRRGEEIPLSARIVALADVFDALTSERPYKKAFSLEESYKIIKSGYASHFDPEIVKVFFKNVEKIEDLYRTLNAENNIQGA